MTLLTCLYRFGSITGGLALGLLAGTGTASAEDHLIRAPGGQYTLRVPAGWKTQITDNAVEAEGEKVWMKLQFRASVPSFRFTMGKMSRALEEEWTGVTSEEESVQIAGNSAMVETVHGADAKGVRRARRMVLVNPIPPAPGSPTFVFLFEVAERDLAAQLPLIKQIEQGLRVGVKNPAPPLSLGGPAVVPARRTPPPPPAPVVRGATPRLEGYVAPNKLYALHKPEGWKVTESMSQGALAIAVTSPDRRSQVNLLWMRASNPVLGRVIRQCREALAQDHPGLTFSDIRATRDGHRAMATVTYPVGRTTARGRAYFETTATSATMQEYALPEAQLDAQRSLAMNVIMSVAFIPAPKGSGRALLPPIEKPLVEQHAEDGSLRLRTPADWAFLAARGRVVAGEPGGMGFIFNSYGGNPMLPRATVVQGVIGTRYLPPSQALRTVLQGYGNRNPAILSHQVDQATVAESRAHVRGGCDAEDMVATWTNDHGVECVGGFKVVNTKPGAMGQWSCIVAGIWGPKQDFYRYYPLLEKVGRSFAIRDEYAQRYIEAGLANLRVLEQRTAAAIRDLNYQREDMQRGWEARQARKDFMDSKGDDYRRGKSYWVSELEGGRVYETDSGGTRDTLTGDYYEGRGYNYTNFEGQNPRWANENMREVSSYELEHGAPPR